MRKSDLPTLDLQTVYRKRNVLQKRTGDVRSTQDEQKGCIEVTKTDPHLRLNFLQ